MTSITIKPDRCTERGGAVDDAHRLLVLFYIFTPLFSEHCSSSPAFQSHWSPVVALMKPEPYWTVSYNPERYRTVFSTKWGSLKSFLFPLFNDPNFIENGFGRAQDMVLSSLYRVAIMFLLHNIFSVISYDFYDKTLRRINAGSAKTRYQHSSIYRRILNETPTKNTLLKSVRRALSNGAIFIRTRGDPDPIMPRSKWVLIKPPRCFVAENRTALLHNIVRMIWNSFHV